jgi:hypothetical protein
VSECSQRGRPRGSTAGSRASVSTSSSLVAGAALTVAATMVLTGCVRVLSDALTQLSEIPLGTPSSSLASP